MARIHLHISLRTIFLALALLLLVFAQAIAVDFLFKEGAASGVSLGQGSLKLRSQNLYFEIDPARSLFLSRQEIAFTNSEISRSELTFLIYPSLIIDRLDFQTGQGALLDVEEWHYGAPVQYAHPNGTVVLNQVQVRFARPLAPNQALTLYLDYHLAKQGFQNGQGANLYELFVGPQAQHAAGFDSGAFPVLEPNAGSALELKIRHPNTERCAIPGELVSEVPEGAFTTTTYRSGPSESPAFSCGVYQKYQKEQDGAAVEFYLAPGQAYSEKMGEIALQYFSLYRRLYGEPDLRVFRFAFVGVNAVDGGVDAENAGNTVYLPASDGFANFDRDGARQAAFKLMVGREEFRYWGRFDGSWSGSLMDWWARGSAHFMSAWAGEMLWGKEFGRSARLSYVNHLDLAMDNPPVATSGAPIPPTGKEAQPADSTLTYEYGALVWEQLRQVMGDEGLQAGLRQFIRQSPPRGGTVVDLIQALQGQTRANLTALLTQWTTSSARIDLSIGQASTQAAPADQPGGQPFETSVVIRVSADQDYDFYTALAVIDANAKEIQLIPVHITHQGDSIVKFSSPSQPAAFQIDPEVRVPQTNLQNDTWQAR